MNKRTERDSMGEILVEEDKLWGAQTQRSFENFKIGTEKMPLDIIYALAIIKEAAALVNFEKGVLDEEKKNAIVSACDEILDGRHDGQFPLSVWQTGSGTQTNMNVNEVISHIAGGSVHPNDHVNKSQSSNDVFPSALHIAAVCCVEEDLLPALGDFIFVLENLENKFKDTVKTGRTHLQDATPVTIGQEFSGYRYAMERSYLAIEHSLEDLRLLALGGTAVGTGLNAPEGFDAAAAEKVSELLDKDFRTSGNKFYSLSFKDSLTVCHGTLKALSADLMKIANDIRLYASGPRCGIGELNIPANEPGSSIMPGKVNPTQCEALTMVCARVMGNDVTMGIAASQGNFQLNVYMPLMGYTMLQSIGLLSDAIRSFSANCVQGITVNEERVQENLKNSLMLVTALNRYVGYDRAAEAAKLAFDENLTLKEAVCDRLQLLSEEEFKEIVDPEKMI